LAEVQPWASGYVQYCFSASCSEIARAAWRSAVEHVWTQVPCLDFKEIGLNAFGTSCASVPSLLIESEPLDGCWSYLGQVSDLRLGGRSQRLNIGHGCEVLGLVVHQLGHALGLPHEHAQMHEDKHVSIGMEKPLEISIANLEVTAGAVTADRVLAYDAFSIMGIAAPAFGAEGINKTSPGRLDAHLLRFLGQRVGLSPGDVERLGKLYGCLSGIMPSTTNSDLLVAAGQAVNMPVAPVTHKGCRCTANESARIAHGYACGDEANGWCCNPDDDPRGPWCLTGEQCWGSSRDYCTPRGWRGQLAPLTQRSCQCRSSSQGWVPHCATASNGFCCNPNSDPLGDWCLTTSACEGKNFDYCSPLDTATLAPVTEDVDGIVVTAAGSRNRRRRRHRRRNRRRRRRSVRSHKHSLWRLPRRMRRREVAISTLRAAGELRHVFLQRCLASLRTVVVLDGCGMGGSANVSSPLSSKPSESLRWLYDGGAGRISTRDGKRCLHATAEGELSSWPCHHLRASAGVHWRFDPSASSVRASELGSCLAVEAQGAQGLGEVRLVPCDALDKMQRWSLGRPVSIASGSVPMGAVGPIHVGDVPEMMCLHTSAARRRGRFKIAVSACGGPRRSFAVADVDKFVLPRSGVGPIRLAAHLEKCLWLPSRASHVDEQVQIRHCGHSTSVSRQFEVPKTAWVNLEPLSARGMIRWGAHPDRCLTIELGAAGVGNLWVRDCLPSPCGESTAVNSTGPDTSSQCFVVPGSLPRVEESVDCQWGSWSEWSACSSPCGAKGGLRWRTRGAARLAAHSGLPCMGWRANAWRESSPCLTSSSVGDTHCDSAGAGQVTS